VQPQGHGSVEQKVRIYGGSCAAIKVDKFTFTTYQHLILSFVSSPLGKWDTALDYEIASVIIFSSAFACLSKASYF
jgi:hypothetical protein